MDSQQARFGSLAALVAGPMWIVYYGIDLISGALGNRVIEKPPFDSPLSVLVLLLFNGAIVGFNAANLGLFRRLGGRSRGWGIAGLVFAALAVTAVALAFVAAVTGFIRSGIFSGFGVMLTCIATTLMGIAVARAHALPGAARFIPLLVGLATFPFIVTITVILGAVLPDYAIAEFPFAASGLGWILIGLALRFGATRQAAPRVELAAA